ncbi:MAG: DinB family protein [Chloroflexota bacterium]
MPGRLRGLGESYRAHLISTMRDVGGEAILRTRPRPEAWSALEYTCHARDVLLVQRERLYVALVEDGPSFAPMYREQRARLARYNEQDVERAATEIGVAAEMIAGAFTALDDEQWQRRLVYNFPSPAERTVAWLARHTLHEAEHHLGDVARVLVAARAIPG